MTYSLPMAFSILLSIVLITGLNIAPVQGKAETETNIETIPIEGTIMSGNCPNFEDVEYSGTMRITTHITTDANGGFHGKDQIVFENLKGTGIESGDDYRLFGTVGGESFSSEDGSPVSQTLTVIYHIKGSSISETTKLIVHLTINAQGEVTVNHDDLTVTCD